MSDTYLAGIDLGSTGIKVLVVDGAGAEVLEHQLPTPWRSGPGGTTELDAAELLTTIERLLADSAVLLAEARGPEARVAAVAVAGMGESGFLVDAKGRAVAPAFAWFDPRGQEALEALPAAVRSEFAGRTGIPLGVQVSAVKLAHLRATGLELAGLRWLDLPEFLVAALGGRAVLEYSLASRTGLIDQDTGAPWPAVLDALGVDASLLPPFVDAGTDLGEIVPGRAPESYTGARLTVAGHDHLVSAVAAGGMPAGHYHVSMGTAEVLLRELDAPLSFAARERLGDYLINCVRHVVPGRWVLVAGVKTGLLMRRALRLAGIADRAGRDRLDAELLALPLDGGLLPGDVEVAGARNDDGVLRLAIHADGVTPAQLFARVLEHGNDEIRRLIEAMDRELPPATSALLTGGWAHMSAVARARAEVLPAVRVSEREQDTAYGATVFARRLLDPAGSPAPDPAAASR